MPVALRHDANDTLAALVRLQADVQQLLDRVAVLEARGGARDAAERAVLPAIGAAIGATTFTAIQLLKLARVQPALAEALEAADITNARELGKLAARLQGQPIAGLCLEKASNVRAGIMWRVSLRV